MPAVAPVARTRAVAPTAWLSATTSDGVSERVEAVPPVDAPPAVAFERDPAREFAELALYLQDGRLRRPPAAGARGGVR